ncbi:MAG: hypothetical protein K1060chlam1_00408 [Candidatus Anoxychlamydiales bacterium]|nr:hypothetical protein [Candidatus Anoxychlamydiales bacterium]
MDNKKNISKIYELTSTLKEVQSGLDNEENLCRKDILMFSDILDEITLTSFKINEKSKNIFTKASYMNIKSNIENVYLKIADIEEKRHLDDDEILKDIHQISFQEDYLELNFFDLLPSDIEMILNALDEEIKNILAKKPYNQRLMNPIIEKVQKKLIDLHFRFDFPIIEELDENKNSYAHRVIIAANEIRDNHPKKAEILIRKIDALLDLAWIAKMFMYSDFSKAKSYFEKLDRKTKDRVEKLLWRMKGDISKKRNDEKKIDVSKALMRFVSEEINA